MIKRGTALFLLVFLCRVACAQAQNTSNKDSCLEKEISDSTRLIFADNGRMKIGFVVEHITWSDKYQSAAESVIQSQFSSNFVNAGDTSFGVLVLYISGTSAVSNGAQYVDFRVQMPSSELLLPENGNGFNDLHMAKPGDPIRAISGNIVFAEEGVLLPPLDQGANFELWQSLRMQTIRENIAKVLSDFVATWKKEGKKQE